MKGKYLLLAFLAAIMLAVILAAFRYHVLDRKMLKPFVLGRKGACTTIQSGRITSSTGDTIGLGYDEFGYNYQAHMFNGRYCDYDRVPGGDYCEDKLEMKWNEAWLSNEDCDNDGLLDRHFGYTSYIGSGAWLTNHQTGDEGNNHWTYFVKIVAAPMGATKVNGVWYAADGTEIGPDIWGQFAIIQEQESGAKPMYLSPSGPGFGHLR